MEVYQKATIFSRKLQAIGGEVLSGNPDIDLSGRGISKGQSLDMYPPLPPVMRIRAARLWQIRAVRAAPTVFTYQIGLARETPVTL